MAKAQQKPAAAQATTTEDPTSLLDEIIQATRPQDDREADRARSYFQQFLDQVVQPDQVISKDVESTVAHWIGEIDQKLSAQLNEIMHHAEFQKLESTWRGLHYLVHQ